jgi:hypothetical protein
VSLYAFLLRTDLIMYSIYLAEVGGQWPAFVKAVMTLWFTFSCIYRVGATLKSADASALSPL